MDRVFSITLNEQRKRDMSTVLHFFLWLTRRSDINLNDYESSLKDAIDLSNKLKHTIGGAKIKISMGEFLMVYTAAQYMQKAMESIAGQEYIMDQPGSANHPDWFEKQKKHYLTVCRFLIRECGSKFNDLPDYARERMRLEEQLQPFEKHHGQGPIKKGA